MSTFEIISLFLNFILGGGLLRLFLLKAKKDEATANTDKVEMDNFRTGTKILVESIVTPLKNELGDVRRELIGTRKELVKTQKDLDSTNKELHTTQQEVFRLRKSMRKIADCAHAEICPVRNELRNLETKKDE